MLFHNNPKKRVFVLGGQLPNGGTYMAYHLGLILHQHWAYEPVFVKLIKPAFKKHSVWDYDASFSNIKIAKLLKRATKEDVLIANPSFSCLMLGLSFPGKKLMYVQGFNTFKSIDGFFDKYVAASPFVQRFLIDTYSMNVPVIEPFIHHDHLAQLIPWEERPDGSVATILKWQGNKLLKYFEAELCQRYSDLQYSVTVLPQGVPHRQVLHELSKHRYFLWLSPAEGFGLPPLEAMMCGCAVVGFHANGGLAYFEHNSNALVCSYPDMGRLVELFATLVSNQSLAKDLVLNATYTANRYKLNVFQQRWIKELIPFLGPPIVP